MSSSSPISLRALAVIAASLFFAILTTSPLRAQSAESPSPSSAKNSRRETQDDSPQKSGGKKSGDRDAGSKHGPEKQADEKNAAGKIGNAKKPPSKRPAATKTERETLAMVFAEKHHPELASLLKTLETMHPQAYASAVRDVSRAAERLEELQERDAERYERELNVWKTRSRVHVVSAEYRVSPGPDLEKKLRNLMQEELDAKRKLLAYEREKAEKRLEQIDRQLRDLDEKGSAMIDHQIERLPKVPASTTKNEPKS